MQNTSLNNIDWGNIQTVLVDMDGTLLDLSFDTRFWLHTLPAHIATIQGISADNALKIVTDQAQQTRGTLAWYCLDHWSRAIDVDIRAIKQSQAHHIKWLPGAQDFVAALTALSAQRWLATNAHPFVLALKQSRVQVEARFDRTITSQDFNVPKEDPRYWQALQRSFNVDLSRCVMIDDSVSVLHAAAQAGVGHQIEILQPDSQFGKSHKGADFDHQFIEVDGVAEISAAISSAV